jgi:hypothetical protein
MPRAAKYAAILGYKKKDGDPMVAKVLRKGKTVDLKANITVNKEDGKELRYRDQSKKVLKDAWVRGGRCSDPHAVACSLDYPETDL